MARINTQSLLQYRQYSEFGLHVGLIGWTGAFKNNEKVKTFNHAGFKMRVGKSAQTNLFQEMFNHRPLKLLEW